MKKVKRALLGTALAGAVIVGASAGTYSWFNAEVKTSGEIINYTLQLNNGTRETQTIFENQKLAPSRTIKDSFEIINTGELSQFLRVGVKFDVDGDINSALLSGYKVKANIKYYAPNETTPTYETGPIGFMKLEDLNALFAASPWIPDASGAEEFEFPSGAKLETVLTVKLENSADNNWQGVKLNGLVEVDGRQVDSIDERGYND